MPIYLKYNTASQEIPLGFFVDSTDGNTEETGLTISNTDIWLWKTGATTLANKNSGGATHISNGIYYAVLDATDTNTIGPLVIFVHESGSLPIRVECVVLPALVYDSIIAGTDNLQVDSIQQGGTTLTARDIGASVLLSSGTGTGQINLSSGAVTAGAISNGAITAASIATGAIDADAIADGAIDAGAIATGAITNAKFAAGAIDAAAIADSAIDAGAIATGAITNAKFAAGAIDAAAIADSAIDAGAIATGAITNAKFAAGAIDAAAIANAAIDNATFAADVGSTAYATNIIALAADKAIVNAALATAAALDAVDNYVDTEVATLVTELAKVPKSDGTATWNATALASINAEVDAALNTAIPGSPTADSINQRIAAIDDLTQASGAGDLAAILTDTGTTLDGKLNTIDDFLDSEVAAILADTNELQTDWVDGGRLDLILDARASQTSVDTLQASVDSIGSGTGAALNFAPEDDNVSGAIKSVTFVGVQTEGDSYTDVAAEDGNRQVITHDGNAIDIVYQFDVGSGRNCSKIVWKGYLTSSNDTITVQAYNGATWDTRKTITGTNGTANGTQEIDLLSTHTGTGADAGKVFIRFVCTGMSSPVLNTDLLLAQAQNLGQTIGYADGAIWVNTNASNESTTPFVDGTADNPVSTWAAALSLSTSTGLKRFRIVGSSSIELSGDSTNYALIGDGLWSLALGGEDITNAYIDHAEVSGVSSGAGAIFNDCRIDPGASTGGAYFVRCGFGTTSGSPFLAAAAGQFVFVDCVSVVAGSGTPYFTFSGTSATTGVNFRRWSGGSNITLDADCTMTMEVVTGGGQTVDTGGGSVEVRGICRAVTVTSTGSSVTQIACVTGPVTVNGDGGTVNIYGVAGTVTDNSGEAVTINNSANLNANIADLQTQIGTAGDGLTAIASVGTITDKINYYLSTNQLFVRNGVTFPNFTFLMRSSTDHITPATGLTVTAEVSLDGAAFAACTNSPTELSDGVYVIDLDADDTAGDVLTLKFTATGADQRTITILTQVDPD